MAEILATLDDINAELPSNDQTAVAIATDDNTALIQISVARVVRGYLSRIIDNSILATWTVPDKAPELVNVIAAKFIAAQHYFNQTAKTSTVIAPDSFAQMKYNEAMAMLNQIIEGSVTLPNVVVDATDNLSDLDYWPRDATDRAFTMGLKL